MNHVKMKEIMSKTITKSEIIRLQKIIEKQDWQQAEFEDSILKEPSDGCGFYKFNVISNSASDYIKFQKIIKQQFRSFKIKQITLIL